MAEYSEDWSQRFEDGKLSLLNILPEHIIDIHHVGSTSIPGLCAKPIIDMIVEVNDFQNNEIWITILQEKGYNYIDKWNNVMPFRRLFARYADNDFSNKVLEHPHIVGKGHKFVFRHLLFRDYLREFRADREAYCSLKRAIIENRTPRKDYNELKTNFIKSIDVKAYLWKYGKQLPDDYYENN